MTRALIKLGYKCNNNCVFCHAKRFSDKELSTNEVVHKIAKAKIAGIKSIVLSGGEATIRPDFFKILRAIEARGMEIGIITNGRMFASREFAERCKDHGLKEVFVSLHSHDAKIHNILCQCEAFSQTVEGIRNLTSLGIWTVANCVVNRMNALNLKEIADLCLSLNVSKIKFSSLVLNGAALENRNKIIYPLEDCGRHSLKACQYAISKGLPAGLEGFPHCCIENKEELIDNLQTNDIIFMSEADEEDFYLTDYGPRIKTGKCKHCRENAKCGGIGKEYAKHYGDYDISPTIYPFEQERLENAGEELKKDEVDPKVLMQLKLATDTSPSIIHYRGILYYILENVSKKEKIIEVGAFIGMFVEFLRKKGYNITGIDNDGTAVRLSDQRVENADIREYGKSGFDLVLCVNVFQNDECKPQDDIDRIVLQIMNKIYSMLKPKGRAIVRSCCKIPISEVQKIGFEILETLERKENMSNFVLVKK